MKRAALFCRRPIKRILAASALIIGTAGVTGTPIVRQVLATTARDATAACNLSPTNPAIKHVVFIEFDNVHIKRDPARDGSKNVPSDLEQMPNLLNFLKDNGSVLTDDHTPLISHTSDDIAAAASGLYPSDDGVATSANSYYVYSNGMPVRTTGFTYWTSRVADGTGAPIPGDDSYNFTSPGSLNGYGHAVNAPAPWVPYTRAGCDVGAVSMSGFVLENKTDIGQAFGTGSGAYTDTNYLPDYIGVAVHCAQASALCSGAGGVADKLPDEPNPDGSPATTDASGTSTAYEGYNALFGSKALSGVITPTGAITDINGNTIVDDFQGTLTPGFPGFSITPQYTLGYAADMLEHGVPVVYAYINNAHTPAQANPYGYGFPNDHNAYGPGEDHYVKQLAQFNDSFGKFFQRLANDGINKSNTLFVVTTDEEDHHVSETPVPATCDGVTTPCTYPVNNVVGAGGVISTSLGELNTNYTGLLKAEQPGITNPASATVNADDAPDVYLAGDPGPDDAATRAFERATAALTATNLLTATLDLQGKASLPGVEHIAQYQANPTEYGILHMLTADPLRTPSFTAFAQPDYFVFGSGASTNCTLTPGNADPTKPTSCVVQNPAFNWNHGDVQSQISTIWLGMVGPGVAHRGYDGLGPLYDSNGVGTFADHTDARTTILALLGLKDDHRQDGRMLVEDLAGAALPSGIAANYGDFVRLAEAYKAINAPVGPFGLATLRASTNALAADGRRDATYTRLERELTALGKARDSVAARMSALLDAATFDGRPVDGKQAHKLIVEARILLLVAQSQARHSGPGPAVGGDLGPANQAGYQMRTIER